MPFERHWDMEKFGEASRKDEHAGIPSYRRSNVQPHLLLNSLEHATHDGPVGHGNGSEKIPLFTCP